MREQEQTTTNSTFGLAWKTATAALLDTLTAHQHLRPHAPLAEATAELTEQLGVCPGAVEQALQWLRQDPSASIGRLRRTELTQLATAIHRYWRQNEG